jgi:hypothetical protein
MCVCSPNALWCGYQIVKPIMDILKGDEHLSTKGEGQKPTTYLHDHIIMWSWMNMKGTWLIFFVAYNMETLYLLALYFPKERLRWFRPQGVAQNFWSFLASPWSQLPSKGIPFIMLLGRVYSQLGYQKGMTCI